MLHGYNSRTPESPEVQDYERKLLHGPPLDAYGQQWVVLDDDYQQDVPAGTTGCIVNMDDVRWTVFAPSELALVAVPRGSQVELPLFTDPDVISDGEGIANPEQPGEFDVTRT